MQQEEAVHTVAGIALVEEVDAMPGRIQQRIIPRCGFGVRVGEVGEQRELNGPRGVREVVYLQPLDQFVDDRPTRQHRRDDDQCAEARRYSFTHVEAGQERGAEASGDGPVDQQQRGVDGRQKTDQDSRRELPSRGADHGQWQDQDHGRDQEDAGDIAGDTGRREAAAQREARWPETQ